MTARMTAPTTTSKPGRSLGGVWASVVRWKRWVLPLVSAFALLDTLVLPLVGAFCAAQQARAMLAQRELARTRHDALIDAASWGNLGNVVYLATADPYINQAGFLGHRDTPLTAAVAGRQYRVVRFLLSQNVDVHKRNKAGETPLHLARRGGSTEIVALLKTYGAKY